MSIDKLVEKARNFNIPEERIAQRESCEIEYTLKHCLNFDKFSIALNPNKP